MEKVSIGVGSGGLVYGVDIVLEIVVGIRDSRGGDCNWKKQTLEVRTGNTPPFLSAAFGTGEKRRYWENGGIT